MYLPITFDIETIPCQDEKLKKMIADTIKPPGTIKLQKSLDEWHETKKAAAIEEAIEKTSFDGALGELVCIGYQIDGQAPECVRGGCEAETLLLFYEAIHDALNKPETRPIFVGHNVIDFDLRFLFQRSIIQRVKPHPLVPFSASHWDDRVFDTMTRFAGKGNRISLDKLAKVLGHEGKDGMTGADVWPEYQKGNISKIMEYCKHDVELTYKCYQSMQF